MYLGLKERALKRKMKKGEIRSYKPSGGKVYFNPADLRDYAYRNKSTTAEEIEEKVANIIQFNSGKKIA